VELKVPTLPDFSSQSPGERAESLVIKRFLELNPHIRLVKGTGLQLEGNARTMDTVPLMQIAGGISPAVIYVNFRFSDTYIQRGFLQPLDEYMASMSQAEIERRVPPAIREVCYREGPDGKMHWYALPTTKMTRALVYRKDLFARAGLNPDKPPRTWSELEAYCRKLSDPAKGKYGIGFVKGEVSSHDFVNLVWSRGGEVIVKDKRGNWHPTFNTPEVVDALYFYTRLSKMRWKDRNGREQIGVAYRDSSLNLMDPLESCAMVLQYLQERLNQQSEVIGFAPVPRSENARRSSSEINAMMYGVFAGVKDPAVVKAAFDYIAFLDSDEANKIRTELYVQRGLGRFVNPEMLKRFGYTRYLEQVDKEFLKTYQQAMRDGTPEPYGKNCSIVYRELSRPIEQALNDRKVLDALDKGDEAAARKRLREILNQAQVETEERMYGIVPSDVAKLRHRLCYLFLMLALAGFSTGVGILIRTFKREAPTQMPGQKSKYVPYLLLIPALVSILVWQYLPLVRGTSIAFQDYNIMGSFKWVGVENFAEVLFSQNFWHAIKVTLIYTMLYMTFGFLSPVGLALLLHEIPRGKVFFRTMFYLPAVLSGLVVMFLWKSFYKPSGLLNVLMSHLGIQIDVSWLDSPSLAMIALIIPVVWAGMGPGCLIYLAALKTIPEEFYEAADIDGAGILRKIGSITLPGLKMLLIINSVGAFIGAFMTSEMILAMTGGGPYTPYGVTEVVGLQLFYTAFMYLKFGVANAMAWVLGFLLIGFTLIQLRQLSRVEFKGGR